MTGRFAGRNISDLRFTWYHDVKWPRCRSMLRLIAFTAVIPVSILFFTSVAAAYQAGGAQHPEPTSFDSICDSAMRSLQKGQAQQAVELLSEAAKLKPNDRTVHCSLGRAFADSGQLTEAIEQFQKCVKL